MADFAIICGGSQYAHAIDRVTEWVLARGESVQLDQRWDWGAILVWGPMHGPAGTTQTDEHAVGVVIGRPHCASLEPGTLQDYPSALWRTWKATGDYEFYRELSGWFVLLQADSNGFQLLTDQLGFVPVYAHESYSPSVYTSDPRVIGAAAGNEHVIERDPVSLVEMMVWGQITYPYSSYANVRELEPASSHAWNSTNGHTQKTLWTPQRTAPDSDDDFESRLEHALNASADLIVRERTNTSVALSGGIDSRVVATLLAGRGVRASVTFGSYWNDEIEIARRVADALDLNFDILWRRSTFYENLIPDTLEIIGSETPACAHSLACAQNGFVKKQQTVVGGFLADTLLKGHWRKENQFIEESIQHAERDGIRFDPALLQDARKRRALRLAEIRELRGTGDDDWQWFWPASRQPDYSYALAAMRTVGYDELFMQKPLVDLATLSAPEERMPERANQVFRRICERLEHIPTASEFTAKRESARSRFGRRISGLRRRVTHMLQPDRRWNDVPGSWVSWRSLAAHSSRWSQQVDEAQALVADHKVIREALPQGFERVFQAEPWQGSPLARRVLQVSLLAREGEKPDCVSSSRN